MPDTTIYWKDKQEIKCNKTAEILAIFPGNGIFQQQAPLSQELSER